MNFPTTSWTMLAEASLNGDMKGREALEKLCQTYRRPVFKVLRARGFSEGEADDLTQDFFLKLFESRGWKRADRGKGRFRAYLTTALLRMLVNVRRDASRVKRGGNAEDISLDWLGDKGIEAGEMEDADPTARLFDREWALRLMQAAFESVEEGFEKRGEKDVFAVLKRFLPGVEQPIGYEEASRLLDRSETAVRCLVHRMRESYRMTLRQLIARTVSAAHEVDDELAYLHSVLKSPPC